MLSLPITVFFPLLIGVTAPKIIGYKYIYIIKVSLSFKIIAMIITQGSVYMVQYGTVLFHLMIFSKRNYTLSFRNKLYYPYNIFLYIFLNTIFSLCFFISSNILSLLLFFLVDPFFSFYFFVCCKKT